MTTGQFRISRMGDDGGDNSKVKIVQNGVGEKKECYEEFQPPDGGARSWLVMLGSFFCNGILFGVINSYSILYKSFHDNLERQNVTDASSKAALIGSLAMGTVFFVSPVSGVLTDFAGIRTTTFLGGLIASLGMLLSSFCVENVYLLYVTYGVMYGLGGALAYTPSLAVLGHYFKKKLGLVNGLVTAGSSAFTISMPYLISIFLDSCGIEWTLRIIALMSSFIMLFAFLFKPVNPTTLKFKKVSLKDAFNVSLFKNKKYVIYAGIVALSLCGYFVPYVYMVAFVHKVYGQQVDAKLAVSCIGVASGVGRLVFGFIGDHPRIDRIFLQQLSFLVIGVSTILLPSSGDSYGLLILLLLFLGLFDGCFISILGPIAFDICGSAGATQAIGFLLGLCAIPLTLGPYVAGLIYERNDSYTLAFVLAGVPPVLGSVAMFLTRCVKSDVTKTEDPSAERLRPVNERTGILNWDKTAMEYNTYDALS